MELKWLEDFISLANTHSFSKSAEERNITQPAFSRRIRALESWLGTPLIDRSTFPTTLTQAGRAFRETAEQTLILMHEARDEFREQQGRARAVISFSALHGITLRFFPQWLKEVQSLIGPLATRIDPGNFHDCVRALVDGDCDFLLCYSNESVPVLLDPQSYPSIKLSEERLLPVSVTDGKQRPVSDIDQANPEPVPWLSYGAYSYWGRVEDFILSQQDPPLQLNPVCENPMGESLKALALEGHGVAWLVESSIRDELADKTLVAVGHERLQMTFDIRIYRSTEKTRPQLIQFWTCVESLAQLAGESAS